MPAPSRRRGGPRARVAFVNSHPIQYFAPLYRSINHSADIEAVPVYLTDVSLRGGVDRGFGQAVKWDVDLLSGTDPIFVPGAEKRNLREGVGLLAPGVFRTIRTGDFDAMVVHGHGIPANHIALAAAKRSGLPAFMRAESHLGLPRSRAKLQLRDWLLPVLYGRFSGMLAIGSANHDFYRSLGVPERSIFHFPYTVDNQRMQAASTLEPAERAALRAQIGIGADRVAILFASKFAPRKHPDDLIRACARLVDEGLPVDLVMVGAGQMEAELRALAASFPRLTTVFTGFLNQSELPRHYAACDIFVLPSENEPWGLIINEVMCAGLPVVASREIGAVPDLVFNGRNGRVFDATDLDGLVGALRPIVADAELRRRMGEESRAIISRWSYAECESGLRAALIANRVLPASDQHMATPAAMALP